MRVISMAPLREFWDQHPESRASLSDWLRRAKACQASDFTALRREFPAADYVEGLTVFNVGGNNYRLVAAIHYNRQNLYVRAVLTHADYDRDKWKRR
jgi:mRNA interferase HigB